MPIGGASTRCPGWCDPIGLDLLGFAIAVAGAIAVVLLVYLFGRRALDVLANRTVGESANIGGPGDFLSVPRGEYYVDAVTDCATWSVTLTPTP